MALLKKFIPTVKSKAGKLINRTLYHLNAYDNASPIGGKHWLWRGQNMFGSTFYRNVEAADQETALFQLGKYCRRIAPCRLTSLHGMQAQPG